jgi:hypothetical protein
MVTLSGTNTGGGTYAATPSGLDIDAATGEIDPSQSNAGTIPLLIRYLLRMVAHRQLQRPQLPLQRCQRLPSAIRVFVAIKHPVLMLTFREPELLREVNLPAPHY